MRWIIARYLCIIQLFADRVVALLHSHLLFGHCDASEISYLSGSGWRLIFQQVQIKQGKENVPFSQGFFCVYVVFLSKK